MEPLHPDDEALLRKLFAPVEAEIERTEVRREIIRRWHTGLARSLSAAVAEQSCEVGFGGIDPRDLMLLTVLSALTGGWWVWDDEFGDAVFIEGWEG